MFRRVFRQRRRIAFSGFFATLTILLTLSDFIGFQVQSQPVWWLSLLFFVFSFLCILAIATAIIAGLLAIAVFMVPTFRSQFEVFALGGFGMALLDKFLPAQLWDLDPLLSVMIRVSPIFLVTAVFIGLIFDDRRLRIKGGKVHRFVSPRSAEQIWAELVPGEGPCEAHWQPNLVATFPVPGQPDALEMHFSLGDGMFLHRTIRFERKEAPRHASYVSVENVSPRNRDVNSHHMTIDIAPEPGGGCTVSWTESTEVLRPRHALWEWFDDTSGDTVDHLRAKFRGKPDWSLTGLGYRKMAQRA